MIRAIKNWIKNLLIRYKYSDSVIGKGVFISMDTTLNKGTKVLSNAHLGSCKVGRYTYIGSRSHFTYTEIGPFCSIGQEVLCGLGKHPINYVSTYPGFYSGKPSGSVWFGTTHDEVEEHQVTYIGADVWIGARAMILGGQNIGVGAIIAAGAVVSKDVPPYAIVGGVPAKIIKYRFDEETIEKIMRSKWWEHKDADLREMAKTITDPNKFLSQFGKLKA